MGEKLTRDLAGGARSAGSGEELAEGVTLQLQGSNRGGVALDGDVRPGGDILEHREREQAGQGVVERLHGAIESPTKFWKREIRGPLSF